MIDASREDAARRGARSDRAAAPTTPSSASATWPSSARRSTPSRRAARSPSSACRASAPRMELRRAQPLQQQGASSAAATARRGRAATSRCWPTSTSAGRLKIDELITERYALDDFDRALDDLEDGRLARGVFQLGGGALRRDTMGSSASTSSTPTDTAATCPTGRRASPPRSSRKWEERPRAHQEAVRQPPRRRHQGDARARRSSNSLERPGMTDPKARLEDMDLEGIDQTDHVPGRRRRGVGRARPRLRHRALPHPERLPRRVHALRAEAARCRSPSCR